MNNRYDEVRYKLENCFFPAVPVPFDKDGNIYDKAQEDYAKYMNKQPITGVAVWVHTGRGLLISKTQRENVFKTWRKALSPDKMLICGVGSRLSDGISENEYIENALEMGNHAKELGADAILVYPPALYRGEPFEDEKVLKYHQKIAGLGIPMILFYLYTAAGGILYNNDLLEKLFQIENVVGIKMAALDSVITYQDVSNLILSKYPKIKLITGEDRMYGYSFARGASGALVGLGAVCQSIQKEMMNAFTVKDYETFVKRMLDVDKLAECTFINPMEGYIQKMLYILYLKGIIPYDAVNDPYGPGLSDMEKEKIKRALIELNEIKE